MRRFRVTIRGKTYDAMVELIRKYRVSIAGHTGKKVRGGYVVDALVDSDQIELLRADGYRVDICEDAQEEGRKRQAEVRSLAVRRGVTHVGAADHYLTVDDVEHLLANVAAAPNTAFTQLIALPNKTWEGRNCHAIRIGHGTQANRPGIYLLGGVHAREWGSPDILINFVEQLCDAYRNQTALTIGGAKFTAAQIQAVVNAKDIYVFPQANPDGRNHSMTADPMWRKNRRPPASASNNPDCTGVDVNRNFDFLWDYTKHFSSRAGVRNSTNPCDPEIYIGPAAVSEPETKNAVWMFDSFPNVGYFIDVHSYSEDILYSWGDDDDQSKTQQMNFRNAAYDGKRGIPNDTGYKEYIPSADKTAAVKLANAMAAAIQSVRGRKYKVMQSMSLYPTAGCSDDYAYSRHFLDAAKAKVLSYTIEWGSTKNPTPFHPPYPEMKQIIQEITAALVRFCVEV